MNSIPPRISPQISHPPSARTRPCERATVLSWRWASASCFCSSAAPAGRAATGGTKPSESGRPAADRAVHLSAGPGSSLPVYRRPQEPDADRGLARIRSSRNPLYFFSIVGAVGVGAQVGSGRHCAVLRFHLSGRCSCCTVLREEAALGAAFGDDYRAYLARVHALPAEAVAVA